jgi:hypothetical protein
VPVVGTNPNVEALRDIANVGYSNSTFADEKGEFSPNKGDILAAFSY